MKISKKIICLFLAVIMAVTMCLPASAENEKKKQIYSLTEYTQTLWEEGYPVISMDVITGVMKTFNKVIWLLTGQKRNSDSFNVYVDNAVSAVTSYVYENSGFDLAEIFVNLPDINAPLNLVVGTLSLDTTELSNSFYEVHRKYKAEGNTALDWLFHFLYLYVGVINVCEVYGHETEDENVFEVTIHLVTKDGKEEFLHSGILVDTKTGECYYNNGDGILHTGFNYNYAELTLYAIINCWMRDFGFCVLYDIAANSMPAVFRYVTRRFKFEYDGREWMIQAWKGNYLLANGGEVGLYCRQPGSIGTFYECASDEQLLPMSMQLCRGDKVIVDIPEQKHWWMNGFNMSGTMYLPDSLTLKFTMEMPDKEMLEAFCKSIDNHYRHDVSYTVDGLTVSVEW